MQWTWQLDGFPNFKYDEDILNESEIQYHENVGRISGAITMIDDNDTLALRIELLTQEALATSNIEGEILNRDSVQSSIKRHLGIFTPRSNIQPKEAGIAELMTDVYVNFNQPLSKKVLCDWHRMITNGRRDLDVIGNYRNHPEPMQIVSGNISRQKIFYEAPPSDQMNNEMKRYIDWYNKVLSDNKTPNLILAGIAHLYFELLHPFEDGNGRIGRALVEKALSQRNKAPTLNSFAKIIDLQKEEYYNALHLCNHSLDIQAWLKYFARTVLKSQEYTFQMVQFIIKKSKFLYKFGSLLNVRQLKVILRLFEEGINGFKGGLSAANYQSISGASAATTTRDLLSLVELGVLRREGILKSTRYYLDI